MRKTMHSRIAAAALVALSAVAPALAQLTVDQKVADFQAIASLYSRQYAPYDWKKTLFGYDHLNLTPWLAQIRQTDNDLDYLDILVRYVAALNDTHSTYRTISDFSATLGFGVDTYFDEGRQNYRVLIESISRTALPSATYPFQIGDELVSVDGVSARDLVERFRQYVSAASVETKLRRAAALIPARSQSVLARAPDLGETAAVEILRQSGATETYAIPWIKTGVPLLRCGAARSVTLGLAKAPSHAAATRDYLAPLRKYRQDVDAEAKDILGYGSNRPVWARPAGFQVRLSSSYDAFYTGVVSVEGYRIGYLRIPNFAPLVGTYYALDELDSEIQYLEDNTDGLVVDVMRNNGGDACYEEDVLSRLIPYSWRAMTRQVRVTWADIDELESAIDDARQGGAPQSDIDLLTARLQDFRYAYAGNRALSEPISTCAVTPGRDPADIVYTKPILLLVDEFSTSAADGFASLFQDNKRGKLFGYRTNGAGGSVLGFEAGIYSEGGTARVTTSMHYRRDPVSVDGYPTTNYVENVGVRPDIVFDYMRSEMLLESGKPFVDAFLAQMVSDIRAGGAPGGSTRTGIASKPMPLGPTPHDDSSAGRGRPSVPRLSVQ